MILIAVQIAVAWFLLHGCFAAQSAVGYNLDCCDFVKTKKGWFFEWAFQVVKARWIFVCGCMTKRYVSYMVAFFPLLFLEDVSM